MVRRIDDVEDVNTYLHQLNQDDKLWLARFMDEYNNARLDFKDLSNNLHNTEELKKSCTDRNNSRNRCIYTIEKAQNGLDMAGNDKSLEELIYGKRNVIDEIEAEEEYEEYDEITDED